MSEQIKRRQTAVVLTLVALGLLIGVPVIWRFVAPPAVQPPPKNPLADRTPADAEPSRPVAETPVSMKRPVARPDLGYAGSDSCRSCHQHNHKTWHASFHRTMTQVPTPDNVVADFDNQQLPTGGKQFRLSRRDDQFWVELDDPDWAGPGPAPRVERQIVLMTGSHHEQDFWYESPYGRLVLRLPFVFRIPEQKWFPDTSVLVTPPDSPSGFGNWNVICIQCHTTIGRPKMRPELQRADTEVVEFGISCEACHGPGLVHVQRYSKKPGSEPGQNQPDPSLAALDRIINPANLPPQRAAQVCGQCHGLLQHRTDQDVARWTHEGFRFRPGDKLEESRAVVRATRLHENPALRERLAKEPHFLDDRFWSDGMVRIIGREYNGLIESPCYQRGKLTCLSCHTMHPAEDDPRPLKEWADDQLRPSMRSDQACLQCHPSIGEQLQAHTHHDPASSGSRCYNCHMPPTAYGLLKAVHSHTIDSPSVVPSVRSGRPNACNMCHLDKSLEWTNQHLADWYQTPKVRLSREQRGVPASILWSLKGDAGQRALMAWAVGWPPSQQASGVDWQGRILAPLLADPYDAVRIIADRSLRTLPGFEQFQHDLVRDAPQRDSVSKRALDTWAAQREQANQSTDLRELLTPPTGLTATQLLDQLLQQRNDRRVQLAE